MSGFYYSGKKISETQPYCKICGSLIDFHVKNGIKVLDSCTNNLCESYKAKNNFLRQKCILGEEIAIQMDKQRRERSLFNKQYWINKGYTEDEAIEKVKEIQKSNSLKVKPENRKGCNKDTMEKRMGKEKTRIFFREKSILCEEYWLKRGYSKEEAKLEISKIQSKNGKMATNDLDAFYKRCWRRVEHWTEQGYSKEEAEQIISEKQKTFSKDICIEKYGEKVGLKIWQERQYKWQESLHNSNKLHVGYSNISQELFMKILESYQNIDKDYVFFGNKNHEYSLRHNKQNYIYDFTDLNKRKIIEFNGDIYHGNPKIYESTDFPNPFKKDKTAQDLWDYDAKKKEIAGLYGFKVLTIWESDYRENKENIILQCLNFLGYDKV